MGVRCGLLVGNICEQKWYRGMEIKNSGEFRIYYNIDTFLQDALFRTASCPIKDFTPRDRSVWSRRMNKSYSARS
eukprot:scaffold37520_cov222-Skeletonema_dohrnii-CCMP3373.AAC.1